MLTDAQKERYCRQILVIGEEKQNLLRTKKVLQVGAGGLGSPLSLYLTAMGIGELILFEFDSVSVSNLGRQVMYKTQDVKKSKGKLTKERLEALNPDVKVTLVEEKFTAQNAEKYVLKADYLVDASDNFETKFLVNDLGVKYNKPFTIAGIQSFEGQLISVIPHQTACYRCVFGEAPQTDRSKPIPIIAPTCGVIGSIEANEVVKGLLKHGEQVLNNLLIVDLLNMDMTKIPIKANPSCICHQK
jgi:molybdopterin-synthase adenylyltransferase